MGGNLRDVPKFLASLLGAAALASCAGGAVGPEVEIAKDKPYIAQIADKYEKDPDLLQKAYKSNLKDAKEEFASAETLRIAEQRAGNTEILENEKFEAYAGEIVDRLLEEWPYERPENLRVVLVGGDSPRAQASPLHLITVNTGVLKKAETEDYLAAYLAHELSHILLDHFGVDAMARDQKKLGLMAALGAHLSDGNWRVEVDPAVLENQADPEALEKMEGGTEKEVAMGATAFATLTSEILRPHWRRTQEEQADILGYDLYRHAGYKDNSYHNFLGDASAGREERSEELKEWADVASRAITDMFNLEEEEEEKEEEEEEEKEEEDGLNTKKLAVERGVDAIINRSFRAFDRASCEYNDGTYRWDQVTDYDEVAYKTANKKAFESGKAMSEDGKDGEEDRQGGIADLKDDPRTAEQIARYETLKKARRAAAKGKSDKARSLLRPMVIGNASPSPKASLAYHEAVDRNGDVQNAENLEALKKAMRSENATRAVYTALATQYRNRGRHDEALAVLNKGEESLGAPHLFLEQRMDIYQATGAEEKLADARRACFKQGLIRGYACAVENDDNTQRAQNLGNTGEDDDDDTFGDYLSDEVPELINIATESIFDSDEPVSCENGSTETASASQ